MVFWCIIGLICASPVAIVILNDFSNLNAVNILTGILALAAGIVIAYFLGGGKKGKEPEKAEDKKDE